MSSILALDQGTTGSTALVIHQDGKLLGRGYREFPQHFPRPGWVEHDPEEIFRSSIEAMREALSASHQRPVALGITNQRETVVLWIGQLWHRLLRPSCGRIGEPQSDASSFGPLEWNRCSESAPVSLPIPTSPPPSSNGCCV